MPASQPNRTKSRQLMDRARRVVAGGISSQIRLNEPGGEPLFFERAQGALMWDADGNEYIDYIQGMGPKPLRSHPRIRLSASRRRHA